MTKGDCIYKILETSEKAYEAILADVEEAIIREGTIDEVRAIVGKARDRINQAVSKYDDLEDKLRARTESSFNRDNVDRQLSEGRISKEQHANAINVMNELDGGAKKLGSGHG